MDTNEPSVIHVRADEINPAYKDEHPDFAYAKRDLLPRDWRSGCRVSMMEIPPGKSAYPYHYHAEVEECFYILSGEGTLRTPDGERRVAAGDFCYFPNGASGAHRLTNVSVTEPLRYIDFDTARPVDVAFYPDSGKIGVYGKALRQIHRISEGTGYYDGE